MKGDIKIEVKESENGHSIKVNTDLENVSSVARLMVLDALMDSLHITDENLDVFYVMRISGVLKKRGNYSES